jgi:hypothetical protein
LLLFFFVLAFTRKFAFAGHNIYIDITFQTKRIFLTFTTIRHKNFRFKEQKHMHRRKNSAQHSILPRAAIR